MFQRGLIFLCSLAVIGAAVLLAPSADKPDKAQYKPVAGWPRLPASIKFGQVTAVAIDSADRVFVFHRGKNPIVVFDPEGKFLRSFGDNLVKNAHGLRIDANDNVWITDLAHHQVMKLDSNGKVLLTLGKKGEPGETRDQFNKPTDVAFAPGGDFYVSDGYGNSRVVKFSKDGKYQMEWGKKGKGQGEFHLPHAICVDAKGRVFVGDRENNRIQVFDGEGKFLFQWQDPGAPFGLFLTKEGRMLLADGRAHLSKVLDPKGKTLVRWGNKGPAAGQFDLPHAICMDSKGAVYVTEITGQRVQKFVGP